MRIAVLDHGFGEANSSKANLEILFGDLLSIQLVLKVPMLIINVAELVMHCIRLCAVRPTWFRRCKCGVRSK